MTPHVSDELPRLLTGEASWDEVHAAAAHLRTCVDCEQELVSAVVAHASLTSAQRFAPEVVASTHRPDASDEPAGELPDLSSVFAQARENAAPPRRPRSDRPRSDRPRSHLPRSHRLGYGLAAAAAAVAIGGGVVAVVSTSGDSGTPSAQTVKLAAYDQGTAPASATITADGRMELDASALPRLSTKRYEVWLTNGSRTQMEPIGWIGANGKATLTVPGDLMSKFTDIEVSVQKVNSTSYLFSGTSVLRGGYA